MPTDARNTETRRDFLAVAGTTAAALAAFGSTALAQSSQPAPPPANRKRVMRVAHLTDIHVQPELKAGEWLAKCLQHVQSQPDKPSLILNGGDAVMDAYGTEPGRVRTLWSLFKSTVKSDCSIPIESCIGNHDIWGWDRKSANATGTEPNYGKKWAMEEIGVARPYRSFNRAGWHFVVLDGVQPFGERDYTAFLDEEQFAWLETDLKSTAANTPVLVLSHIPILSVAPIVTADPKEPEHRVSRSLVHGDVARIKDLFLKHPNVKLCVSGHLHLVDRVEYCGVTYMCDGAVSGAWWKGDHHECKNGYALLNLYDDGSFEREYTTFGWTKA